MSTSSDVLLECFLAEACPGGNGTLCAEGYESFYCNVCSDDYFAYENFCLACDTNFGFVILVIIVFGLIFGGVLFLIWYFRDKLKGSVNLNFSRSTFKILLAFAQILYAVQHVFSLELPAGFEWFIAHVLSWLSLAVVSGFVGLECVMANSYYDNILIKTIGPILFTLFLSLILGGSQARAQSRGRRGIISWENKASQAHSKLKKLCTVIWLWMT